MTLGNHTAQAQTVILRVTLPYRGSHSDVSLTVPLQLRLAAVQTLSKSVCIPLYAWFPRGAYTISVTATDGSGDTASSSSASLTVS